MQHILPIPCKILVPVDFSDFSRKALPVAQMFAELLQGKLTPCHVYDVYSNMDGLHYYSNGAVHCDGDLLEIEQYLTTQLRHFAAQHVAEAWLDPPIALRDTHPAPAIVEASKAFDLIVMSSHGRSGFSRLLLGSIAEKVLRLGYRPIVIVEDEQVSTKLQTLLLTTDFSPASYAAFPYAQTLVEASGAHLHLLHVVHGHFADAAQRQALCEARHAQLHDVVAQYLPNIAERVQCSVIPGEDSPQQALRQHLLAHPYNLVIMSALGRAAHPTTRLGSTVAALIRSVHTTFMVIQPESF